jgi:hypothetical protein
LSERLMPLLYPAIRVEKLLNLFLNGHKPFPS